ncbi:MAG: DNA-binding response regulator, partial [Haloferacaceae archaeon]
MAEPIRVLHVDDEPGFADTTAAFLERESDRLAVETATSVEEALDHLAGDDVDCIVSDY